MARSGDYVYLSVAIPKDSPLLAYLRQRRVATGRHECHQILDLAQDAFEQKTTGLVVTAVQAPSKLLVQKDEANMQAISRPVTNETNIDFDSFGDPD